MKVAIIFVLVAIIGITLYGYELSSAATYLIINSTTKEVISLSPEDDAVLSNKDWQKIVLPDNYSDIALPQPATLYKYDGKKFILNQAKIDAQTQAEYAAQQQVQKKQQDKQNAVKKLQAVANLTDNETSALVP